MKLTAKQVKQVKDELEMGMDCYVNSKTGDIVSLPDQNDPYFEEEMWEEPLKEIKNNEKDFVKIDKMSSSDSFRVMEYFSSSQTNAKIRDRLENALEKRKPFRKFRDVLEEHDDLLQLWYHFKTENYINYTIKQLKYHRIDFEAPERKEKTKSKHIINFHNKNFTLLQNSKEGTVDSNTIFEYEQDGDLVTADYHGGDIRYGKIIAQLDGDELDMRYQCLTTADELKTGKAIAKITFTEEGKIRLDLDWEWLGETEGKGTSVYVEV